MPKNIVMSKDNKISFVGQPILKQIIKLIPNDQIIKAQNKHKTNR